MKNTYRVTKTRGWSWGVIILHWISAIAIIGLFALGLWMVDLTYYSEWYKTAPYWHKSVGLLLAGATVLRIVWRLSDTRPASFGGRFTRLASRMVHASMYGLLIALFVSGYLISTADGRAIDVFTWFAVPAAGELFDNQEDFAGAIHFYLAWALIILTAVHTMAALKHHYFNKNDTLTQMLKR